MRAAARRSGLRLSDLTVLSADRDPYRLDTPLGHREARWFVEWLDELSPDKVIHLKGLHYALVSKGGVLKPNGKPFLNTYRDFVWLTDGPAKAARWLGYVSFERIVDQRNDAPIECRCAPESASTPIGSVFGTLFGGDGKLHVTGEIDVRRCVRHRRPSVFVRLCLPPVPLPDRAQSNRAALLLRVLRREVEPSGRAGANRAAVWGQHVFVLG